MKVSVIISYYNKFEVLFLLLKALENQSFKTFDVIIADDGSNEESSDNISQYLKKSPLKVTRVWHEDKGFRKNKILNQAILASNSDYLIFIDGDCIPQHFFVEDHVENAEKGCCLSGRRVNLDPKMSERLKSSTVPDRFFAQNFWSILYYIGVRSKGRHFEKGLRITNKAISKLINNKDKGLLGCNMSFFKKDLLNINGFDERYEAAAVGEDTDIEFRLRLSGVKVKSVLCMANQLHVYHKELPRDKANDELFKSVMLANTAWTKFGINRSL